MKKKAKKKNFTMQSASMGGVLVRNDRPKLKKGQYLISAWPEDRIVSAADYIEHLQEQLAIERGRTNELYFLKELVMELAKSRGN
jgi:hypothetical protein